jgi:hypothetical protein
MCYFEFIKANNVVELNGFEYFKLNFLSVFFMSKWLFIYSFRLNLNVFYPVKIKHIKKLKELNLSVLTGLPFCKALNGLHLNII